LVRRGALIATNPIYSPYLTDSAHQHGSGEATGRRVYAAYDVIAKEGNRAASLSYLITMFFEASARFRKIAL
jgi:hypothetical protein